MKTPRNSTEEESDDGKYQYIEYESDNETVVVIQDHDNESAWIQSTVSIPIEP